MAWLPTKGWSGKIIALGTSIIFIGILVVIGGNRVVPNAIPRQVALVFGAVGIAGIFLGLLISGFGQEAQRQRLRVPILRFYNQAVVDLWRSLPSAAKVAVGMVLPATMATFGIFVWLGISGRITTLALGICLLVFVILMMIAGRGQAR